MNRARDTHIFAKVAKLEADVETKGAEFKLLKKCLAKEKLVLDEFVVDQDAPDIIVVAMSMIFQLLLSVGKTVPASITFPVPASNAEAIRYFCTTFSLRMILWASYAKRKVVVPDALQFCKTHGLDERWTRTRCGTPCRLLNKGSVFIVSFPFRVAFPSHFGSTHTLSGSSGRPR